MSDDNNRNEELFREVLDKVNWKFGDERMPTEAERQSLTRLMYLAFCDLRRLAREEKLEQVRALAEAFHNIPLLMHTQNFSFRAFREFLQNYQGAYANAQLNYLQEWEKLNTQTQTSGA
jgi:hypothetical protein